MTRPRPRISPRMWFTLSIVAAFLMAFMMSESRAASAQADPSVTWQPTGLTAQTLRLYTPASGALFARTTDGLMRSDDAGDTWRAVTMPAAAPLPGLPIDTPESIVVDPANHAVIYAMMADGLYKTSDEAQTWSLILPTVDSAPTFNALAISPSDNQRLYLALNRSLQGHLLLVMRSNDGGATWTVASQREVASQVSCTWSVPLLQAHPTVPDRVIMASGCVRTGTQSVVEQSRDSGGTWTTLYEPKLAAPHWLAFGGAATPGRLVMGLNKDDRGGGSLVSVSNDDGATWTTTLEFTGGGGMSGGGPNVTIGGLTIDPTNPDRVLVGLRASKGAWDAPAPIRSSADGGLSWATMPTPPLDAIRDVAYGIDGRLLFVATDTGVWRAAAP